jgi:hypothetical protein
LAEQILNQKLVDSINIWGASVVVDMVQFLSDIGKTNTGALAKSLRAEARIEGERIVFEFLGNDYSEFVRQGVRGKESDSIAPNSDFKFGTKTGKEGGLRGAIDKWTITKGIDGVRDSKGRFTPRKTLVSFISRKIYRFGIRPTNFVFPFFQRQDELTKLVGVEISNQILIQLKTAFNGSK